MFHLALFASSEVVVCAYSVQSAAWAVLWSFIGLPSLPDGWLCSMCAQEASTNGESFAATRVAWSVLGTVRALNGDPEKQVCAID